MTVIPIIDLALASDPDKETEVIEQLRSALFEVGFLYVKNHGVSDALIEDVEHYLPKLFELQASSKTKLSKINSPHFLGYSRLAEEVTQGRQDLREQYDFATELPVIHGEPEKFWRLEGPNQWPEEIELPGFRRKIEEYHDAIARLSQEFVHLIERAFDIPIGTFDKFFSDSEKIQHRFKLVKYHVASAAEGGQGVGAHKDSSGWLTFLHQVGDEKGLEVFDKSGKWIAADPVPGTFVVNFGRPFEVATDGAVQATLHRVQAPTERVRYSIPFFAGLPLDLRMSNLKALMPESVRVRGVHKEEYQKLIETSSPVSHDPRWDVLGEFVLRVWLRSHSDVGLRWYGADTLAEYTE